MRLRNFSGNFSQLVSSYLIPSHFHLTRLIPRMTDSAAFFKRGGHHPLSLPALLSPGDHEHKATRIQSPSLLNRNHHLRRLHTTSCLLRLRPAALNARPLLLVPPSLPPRSLPRSVSPKWLQPWNSMHAARVCLVLCRHQHARLFRPLLVISAPTATP